MAHFTPWPLTIRTPPPSAEPCCWAGATQYRPCHPAHLHPCCLLWCDCMKGTIPEQREPWLSSALLPAAGACSCCKLWSLPTASPCHSGLGGMKWSTGRSLCCSPLWLSLHWEVLGSFQQGSSMSSAPVDSLAGVNWVADEDGWARAPRETCVGELGGLGESFLWPQPHLVLGGPSRLGSVLECCEVGVGRLLTAAMAPATLTAQASGRGKSLPTAEIQGMNACGQWWEQGWE